YGNTIFHLEPNVKDSPGGMRDYQATIWLRQLAEEKKGIRNITAAEEEMCAAAVDFLSATRCFLHYTNGRNDNTLTYELHEAAAEHTLGISDGLARTPSDRMRQYFRHARTLNRQLLRYLEQKAPVPLTLRQRLLNAARAAKYDVGESKHFHGRDGLLEVTDLSALSDRAITYSLFAESARTGTPLSREAERSIGYVLIHPELPPKNTEMPWEKLREILILALLLHDVGKGMPIENHVTGSLAALDSAARRLKLSPEERAEIQALIEHHLDMSATVQRRDIFDPATVAGFAESVTNQERLQRLCLLTYADIHAVNPEALTPWKAEMLWQLFVATSNYFSRTLDRDRLHAHDEVSLLGRIEAFASRGTTQEIERFLEGFPRRYLAVHSPEEIAAHFGLYRKLSEEPVQTQVAATRHGFALTLLTPDRPALFSTISGVLAGWGMNINKADAFANAAGIILDTFYFTDLHRTLELNP